MPEILKDNGVYTHLITDHQHYWEDGGATYHNRYNSYEFVRGQEGDLWKGHVKPPVEIPPNTRAVDPWIVDQGWTQDWINRSYMPTPDDQPQAHTFRLGMEFIRNNHQTDNWYLQIETFDPHEPFFSHSEYKRALPLRLRQGVSRPANGLALLQTRHRVFSVCSIHALSIRGAVEHV